jgi:hypothetical protein
MKISKDGHKIIMRRKDFVQCYFAMRPLLKKYFSGNITTSDFINQLEHIYKVWFA